ncbi:MAG: tRNA (adenosine(37)-N6)-threonylcarbamoyltransferase complex ATPase subunit type 1 TsaE [Ruminococcus sp.]|nr:tRNA (adenosine(37)-N6)-threonylcarbamoyltransferase complex ATPase subunit type 1 TsaE [Ruminococcus sp.]
MDDFLSHSVEQTEKFAEEFSKNLNGNEIIAMYGELGAGKTAFARGLARGLGVEDAVSSPTFAIVNEYQGVYSIYHFDMYRIESWNDLDSIGFFDYVDNGVIIIEWSENIEGALPNDIIRININKTNNENERIIRIEGF